MNRREFHFSEGSSNKFWSIELQELSFIVHYGKIGTQGQSQEKVFATAELAVKEHDKLIAEKTKKGYVEVQSGQSSTPRPVSVVKNVEEEKKSKLAAKKDEPQSVDSKESINQIVSPPQATSHSLTLERRVRLPQTERNRLSWLWQAIERPAPKKFDQEAFIRSTKKWHCSYGYITTYNVNPPDELSQEEAWHWIAALYVTKDKERVSKVEDWEALVRKAVSDVPPVQPKKDLIPFVLNRVMAYLQWLPVLVPLYPARELANLLYEKLVKHPHSSARSYMDKSRYAVAGAFAARVLCYESASVREEILADMRERFHSAASPDREEALVALAFMGTIRGGSELESFLMSPSAPAIEGVDFATLAGLSCEEDFVSAAKRIGLTIPVPNDYQMDRCLDAALLWLAATEWRHLDMLVQSIVAATSKDECAALARVLALVEAPEAAPAMLEVMVKSKAPAVAQEWFVKHPLHMAVGLTPVAMGNSKMAETAQDLLHRLRRNGQHEILSAALTHLAEKECLWLQAEIIEHQEDLIDEISHEEMPSELSVNLASLKPIKAGAWLQSNSLPPVKIAGKKLSNPDVDRMLSALKDAAFEYGSSNSPVVALLKQHADPTSLDTFAWKLFEQWLTMGAASKEKWAFGAIGHLGGDASVLKLTPLIREWPGESQHQRAVFGLEILRAIGTDTALMSLNGIAQKLKFQGLKEKAKLMMEGIALARGFTREQLADRIVPDCGLDAQGGRVFDFGPRQFQFILGAEMKPLVRDASGKIKSDLPSPNNSDDKEKAEAAVASWKILKKTLKEVLKIQAERLEDAMITGRRWTSDEFHTLLVMHPLMINLVRQLLFACYDENRSIKGTFRVTEDQSLADANDDPFDLPSACSIGVVHPAHLDDATKSAWGQVLSDYEIIPPFPQLGRQICCADSGDLELTEITRFKGPKIPGITVYGILERSHWLKDTPADAGGFVQHSKFFPSVNLTAFIQYTGMSIGYYDEPQEIESVYFVPGHVKPEMWGQHNNKLPIKEVDSVVMSETLRLVHAVVAKGE